MILTKKDYYKIENKLKERTLFRDFTADTLTKKEWNKGVKIIKEDFKQIVGKKEYNKLKPMIEEFLFTIFSPDAPYEYTLATCRRLSKSTKMIILMLVMIIRIPWYNAVMTVKFHNRIARSILPAIRSTLSVIRNSGWISLEEYSVLKSSLSVNSFTFDGRTIIFSSAESPDAALSVQANTDVDGYVGIFIHQVDDELIIEDFSTSGDSHITMTDSEQMTKLSSITESVNRFLKAPYGASFQRVRLFNTWDFNHEHFIHHVENVIPASDRYKNQEKKDIAESNRIYLMDEEVETDGILIADYTGEDGRARKTGRISYKAIPEDRFNVEDYVATKTSDYNRWLPIYGAVPGKTIGQEFTHPIDVTKMKEITYDEFRNMKISNVLIGLDRGKRDKTALSVVLKETGSNKFIFFGGIEIEQHQNELRLSKMIVHNYLKQILLPLQKLFLGTVKVWCDYHAYDFIDSVNEVCESDPETALVRLGGIPTKLYDIEPVTLRGFWNKIVNRIDWFNDKFLDGDIQYIDHKFTNLEQEVTGLTMLERFEAVVDDPRTGSRNEKYKQNDLDLINSIEYAIVEEIN